MTGTLLADQLQITKQSVNDLLRHLEQHGYITRQHDPTDGRARIVKLTPRGHEASAVAGRVFTGLEAKWEEALGENRMTQLRTMLAELASLGT